MKDDLIKRYIYAVTRHLPEKSQSEIEKEIKGMIDDMLDARCGTSEPSHEDIRAVLGELGLPEELAIKYSGDENKALISGIYLIWYKKILKIVLPIAAAGVSIAILLSAFTSLQHPYDINNFIVKLISEIFAGAVGAATQGFLWITIIFIILERNKVKLSQGDFLSQLPPVPDKRAQIKIYEPIISILLNITALVLFLGFPHLIGMYSVSTGWIPIFNEDYIRLSWYLIVLSAVFGIVCEIFKLIERRYSKRLAAATTVTGLLTGAVSIIFFSGENIMNPAFIDAVSSFIGRITQGTELARLEWAFTNVNIILLAIVVFGLLTDICVTSYRAIRYDK